MEKRLLNIESKITSLNEKFDSITVQIGVTRFPKPNIAICSQCGWKGSVTKCEIGEEGDWETGYYKIDLCPICEDGGCIDDYDVSITRTIIWNIYRFIVWIKSNFRSLYVLSKKW